MKQAEKLMLLIEAQCSRIAAKATQEQKDSVEAKFKRKSA